MEYRTHTCGELRESDAGKTVTLSGWLENLREVGQNFAFCVLRDFYGITQVVIETPEMMERIKAVKKESVLQVTGTVRVRESINDKLPTGRIEVVPQSLTVLGKCRHSSLPFEINASKSAGEDLRLKYRFLDLRNPAVKDRIVLRSQVVSALRQAMTDLGFLEITTPILTCSSPEGARDYLVPSRLHPGKFYALPQAPQQFKQLLMASGIDKYFQIAPCFRDEDARADRSPGEFYQLDMEMAFAGQEDVFAVLEQVLPPIFARFGKYPAEPGPFRRIPYFEALEKYGTDKPDLRIRLELQDATALLKDCGFGPFAEEGTCIKALVVPGYDKTRKITDGYCTKVEQETGGKMFWTRLENGAFVGGIAKFLQDRVDQLTRSLGLTEGCFIGFTAGKKPAVYKAAGFMRRLLGTEVAGLMEENCYRFCWIVDFPMYEIGEESGKLEFCHNPFSMPQGGLKALEEQDPLSILAYQYDIVCNGIELSSGAVRNHDPEIMVKAFQLVGLDEADVQAKFPAMYHAFTYGAPPHAGVAPGVDRMVMLLADEPNIREVIAFPMNKNAQDVMMGAPAPVEESQLRDVHIAVTGEPEA